MLKALAAGYDALKFLLVQLLLTGELEPVGGTTKTGKPRRSRRYDIAAMMPIFPGLFPTPSRTARSAGSTVRLPGPVTLSRHRRA